MFGAKVLTAFFVFALFVAVSSGQAQQIEYDGPHTVTEAGATEAEAAAAALAAQQEIIDDFNDQLSAEDHVMGILQSTDWDGSTYEIVFTIVWVDNP